MYQKEGDQKYWVKSTIDYNTLKASLLVGIKITPPYPYRGLPHLISTDMEKGAPSVDLTWEGDEA